MKRPRFKNVLPPGWDERRVQDVIGYYDAQSADEEAVEIEELFEESGFTLMRIPISLVADVRKLLEHGRSRHAGRSEDRKRQRAA